MDYDRIKIVGARTHNLQNISVDIPRGKLVVVTGLSGSGKSSLAFDTIYAEGQRRYVESLSAYARQFLGLMDKPDVDLIEGLSPAISIDQKTTSHNPRSTVGTVTEIYDYLRLLYARVGHPHCPQCGRPVQSQSLDQIVEQILSLPHGTSFMILAPIIHDKKGEHRKLIDKIRADGFVRVRIDGEIRSLDDDIVLNKKQTHSIEIVVDRLTIRDGLRTRLADSIETALRLGNDIVYIQIADQSTLTPYSLKNACVHCGISLPELTPRLFSFNNPTGACPDCTGLGRRMTFDTSQIHGMYEWMYAIYKFKAEEDGSEICPTCHGARLKPEALAVTVGDKNIYEVARLSIRQCQAFFDTLTLTDKEQQIARQVIKEIRSRLKFLLDVGLDYLTLSRSAGTLAGGEAQRIRLATQIGSGLTGVLYILDEPSIGLHPRDNQKLLDALKNLRDLGNTLIVVEHDDETMLQADHIIDIGPGAGDHGGHIVAQGTARDLMNIDASITGQYLSGRRSIVMPNQRRVGNGKFIEVIGAAEHNLKSIDVQFPLGELILVTGVSGSGKSTLVNEILYKSLARLINKSNVMPGRCVEIRGVEHIDKVINIDQQPIGRTPRSNPATYTGVFDIIRQLFAATKMSQTRGYKAGRFSFNVKGGRCESCCGAGILQIEMNFLPDVYVECDVCHGARFNRETLEVRYKDKNISDVLNMTVDEAIDHFSNVPRLVKRLQIISDVGLGYIKLGQPATTLSGGEAQRVKLATELSRQSTGRSLYILDEPTTGLHAADIDRLLKILQRLVDAGNTVIVIEHNLDVVKCADWIIDLGPEGGDLGGNVVATGTPEQIATIDQSYTGQFLRRLFNRT